MRRTVIALFVSVVVTSSLGAQVPDTAAVAEAGPTLVVAVDHDDTAYATSLMAGRGQGLLHGRETGTGGWFAIGFTSGLFLPLVGAAGAYALAGTEAVSSAAPPVPLLALFPDRDPGFQEGFRQGYREAVLSKRKSAALTGGLVGSATYVALVVLFVSALDY